MRQVLGLLLFITAFCFSGVRAYELSSMKVESALNEPLLAEIELIGAEQQTDTPVIVDLASKLDFMRHRVKRNYYVSDLKTTVTEDSQGQAIIRVQSHEPMISPSVEFLVMLLSEKGKTFGKYKFVLPQFRPVSNPPVMVANRVSEEFKKRRLLARKSKSIKNKPKFGQPSTRLFSSVSSNEKNRRHLVDSVTHSADADKEKKQVVAETTRKDMSYSKIAPTTLIVKTKQNSMIPGQTDLEGIQRSNHSALHRLPSRRLLAHFDGPSKVTTQAMVAKHIDKKSKAAAPHEVKIAKIVKKKPENSVYKVRPGDSISRIAMLIKPRYPSSSWQDLMRDLVKLNPDAFINKDINRLKVSVSLKLPQGPLKVDESQTVNPNKNAQASSAPNDSKVLKHRDLMTKTAQNPLNNFVENLEHEMSHKRYRKKGLSVLSTNSTEFDEQSGVDLIEAEAIASPKNEYSYKTISIINVHTKNSDTYKPQGFFSGAVL